MNIADVSVERLLAIATLNMEQMTTTLKRHNEAITLLSATISSLNVRITELERQRLPSHGGN